MYIPYNKNLLPLARELRKNSTQSEIFLWLELKGKSIEGYKFYRQKPILNFIVDFYCPKGRLIIEIDGMTHDSEIAHEKDLIRQAKIEALGLTFLRFSDEEVLFDRENVVRSIEGYLRSI